MTKKEILKELDTYMKKINKDLDVYEDKEGDIALLYKNKLQAWFSFISTIDMFELVPSKKIIIPVKYYNSIIQFYVQGQKLLEELDERNR